uniref:Membrane metallo-endopeptidase-like 1 n=1 Tax=Salarias fasciatus TaxID=181472 RepID=A0A672FE39_SALFA
MEAGSGSFQMFTVVHWVFAGQLFRSSLSSVCTTADCVTAGESSRCCLFCFLPSFLQSPVDPHALCLRPRLCRPEAARLLQNMDDSVKPCDNFYQYACGGWLERHVIPETSSRHSIFDILRDKLEIVLKGVLETTNEQDRDAIRKAKVLYSSCMNESKTEQNTRQLFLFTSEDWPVASEDWNTTETWSLEDTLATLTARFHKKVMLDMYVWTDDRDSQRHIIYVRPQFALIPMAGSLSAVREAYLHFMVSIAKITREDRNLTQDDDRVWEEMMQVLELETDIANVSAGCSRKGVVTQSLSEINDDRKGPELLLSASWLFSVCCRTMQNYLTWQIIFDRVNSLSRRFKEARARYRKDAWWRECVRYVQSSMENAVGSFVRTRDLAGESKRMVSDLISKIQTAFVETLEELSWMDAPSKEKAREKAMAIKEHIGYPDHILQESNQKLDQEYAHLNFSEEHYFENILENLRSEAHKGLKKLREPVDPDLWIIGAAVVNAFYSHNRNQIVFPAGILQPPFFSKHQHQALNFGGIGMVIGHEITHGFDDNGRNFDKDGNMLNWWSNYSAEHFKDQSQCMVQQYGNFNWELAGGQNVSGISTLGENIADNGGVRQAYKAYLKWVEMEGEEVWCGAYRPEFASQSIKTDSHSPLEYRVLGSLQNFEAFSEAFQCPKGSRMNPEQKCRVW